MEHEFHTQFLINLLLWVLKSFFGLVSPDTYGTISEKLRKITNITRKISNFVGRSLVPGGNCYIEGVEITQ